MFRAGVGGRLCVIVSSPPRGLCGVDSTKWTCPPSTSSGLDSASVPRTVEQAPKHNRSRKRSPRRRPKPRTGPVECSFATAVPESSWRVCVRLTSCRLCRRAFHGAAAANPRRHLQTRLIAAIDPAAAFDPGAASGSAAIMSDVF